MTVDTKELRKLAEAAPEGPWFGPEYSPGSSYVFDCDLGTLLSYESIETEQDACLRYVAAANPATVLALLDELERLKGCDKAYAEAWEKARDLQSEMDEVVGRRDQIKAENETLRKDAERYRAVRLVANMQGYSDEQFDQQTDDRTARFDAAIAKDNPCKSTT